MSLLWSADTTTSGLIKEPLSLSWSPFQKSKYMVAFGCANGLTLVDYEPVMRETSVDAEPVVRSNIQMQNSITAVSWGKLNTFNNENNNASNTSGNGIIAAGDSKGLISIFGLGSDCTPSPLQRVSKHSGDITCAEFSDVEKGIHLLATGGKNDEIYVTDLKNMKTPNTFSPANSLNKNTNAPISSAKGAGDTTCLAWNSQVVHVVASGSSNGIVSVWDLRQKSAWCTLNDSNMKRFNHLKWNPAQGLYLMTAANDPTQPVLKLWDLRRSTTQPLTEFSGHRDPILTFDWTRHDEMVVASYSNDGKFLLWDLYSGVPILDIHDKEGHTALHELTIADNGHQNPEQARKQLGFKGLGMGFEQVDAGDLFGSNSGENEVSQNGGKKPALRKKVISFSPCLRTALISLGVSVGLGKSPTTSSVLALHSINSFGSTFYAKKRHLGFDLSANLRMPKWKRKHPPFIFGFGGKYAKLLPIADKKDSQRIEVGFISSTRDRAFADSIIEMEQQLASLINGTLLLTDFCTMKSKSTSDQFMQYFWSALILLQKTPANNRSDISKFLGFDESAVASNLRSRLGIAEETVETTVSTEEKNLSAAANRIPGPGGLGNLMMQSDQQGSAADIFGDPNLSLDVDASNSQASERKGAELAKKSQDSSSLEPSVKKVEHVLKTMEDADADKLVEEALLLGDFNLGTKALLDNKRFADALVLSACGGEELWTKTVHDYLELTKSTSIATSGFGYRKVLAAVLTDDLKTFIADCSFNPTTIQSGLWKEYLLVIAQYAKPEEFNDLCNSIGIKLNAVKCPNNLRSEQLKGVLCCSIISFNSLQLVNILQEYHQAHAKSENAYYLRMGECLLVINHILVSNGLPSLFSFPVALKMLLTLAQSLSKVGYLDFAARFLMELDLANLDTKKQIPAYGLIDKVYYSHSNPTDLLHFLPGHCRWFPYKVVIPSGQLDTNDNDDFNRPDYIQEVAEHAHFNAPEPVVPVAGLPIHTHYNAETAFSIPAVPISSQQFPDPMAPQPQMPIKAQWPSPSHTQPPKPRSPRIPLNDGFGTTVGNPMAGQKYGNVTTSNLDTGFGYEKEATAFAQSSGNDFSRTPHISSNPSQLKPLSSPSPSQPPIALSSPQGPPLTASLSADPGRKHRNPSVSSAGSAPNYDQAGNPIPGASLGTTNVFDPSKSTANGVNDNPAHAPSAPALALTQKSISPQLLKVVASFESLGNMLGGFELSGAEQKYLQIGISSISILREKAQNGSVSDPLQVELDKMAAAIDQYDFNTANQLKLSITRHFWTSEKDWLKGFSQLISLAQKKYPTQY